MQFALTHPGIGIARLLKAASEIQWLQLESFFGSENVRFVLNSFSKTQLGKLSLAVAIF